LKTHAEEILLQQLFCKSFISPSTSSHQCAMIL
jgi:hypothetical protein